MSIDSLRAHVEGSLRQPNGADDDPRPEPPADLDFESGLPVNFEVELPPVPLHPLAHFVRLSLDIARAPEYLLDGVLIAGMAVIVGSRGIGKTTALVPLFALCAHLCLPDHPLKPKLRRRVIYIAEDADQVERVLFSWLHFSGVIATEAEVRDWFRVVPAMRMPVDEVVEVASTYVKLSHQNRSVTGATYEALPLVVFDTRSAVFDVANEDDNAESSKVIATLRQRFAALPVVIVTHPPKAILRADVKNMTARGAGSLEADVQQVAYMFLDEATGKRYLTIGGSAKKRFESSIDEVEFTAVANTVRGADVLGDPVDVRVMHCEAQPILSRERRAASDEAKQQKLIEEETARRTKLLDVADIAWRTGNPLSQSALDAKVGGRAQDVRRMREVLIAEGWLALVDVPAKQRANMAKSTFVVRLEADERTVYLASGNLPAHKQVIPASWLRPAQTTAADPAGRQADG